MQIKVATFMLQGKLALLKNLLMEAIIPAQKPELSVLPRGAQ